MSALVQHKDITDPDIHEPKGASTATSGQVYVADGAGSGSFQDPAAPAAGTVDHGDLAGLTDDDHPQYWNDPRGIAQIAIYLDRHHVNNSTAANNNTTTPVDFINQAFTIQNTALYKVSVNYTWSLNDGAQDFEATLLVGGVVVTEEHKQEPKDVAGAGAFGTNQRHKGQMVAFVNLAPGSTTFQLQFAGSAINDNAAVYQADLYVERWT